MVRKKRDAYFSTIRRLSRPPLVMFKGIAGISTKLWDSARPAMVCISVFVLLYTCENVREALIIDELGMC
jgi:hypothetical protein